MLIKPIKNQKEYKQVCIRMEELFMAKKNTPAGDELEVLAMLVDAYEQKKYEITAPDPIEAIKFRMDQLGMSVRDLGEIVGYQSRASEILHRKRGLSLAMIKNIYQKLHIPAHILLQ